MRDDFDSVVADRFKVLDHVPVPDTWSRIQRSGQARPGPKPTGEVLTMLDLETPVPNAPRQKRPMRVVFAAVLAAAAVVAIALVVTRDGHHGAPADQPSPTVNVPSTTPPRALFGSPQGVALGQGTYFVDEVEGTPTARIFVTIGDGWWKLSGVQGLVKQWPSADRPRRDVGGITFSRPARVFSDACHWSDGYLPGPVTTVDDLVAALSEQRGWVDVTAPSDISVDGHPGKAFQRTAPAPAVFADCTTRFFGPRVGPRVTYGPRVWPDLEPDWWPEFKSWENENATNFGGSSYSPGDIETLLVLDIDGTVVVISAILFAGSSAAERAEFAAVLDSIRIERG